MTKLLLLVCCLFIACAALLLAQGKGGMMNVSETARTAPGNEKGQLAARPRRVAKSGPTGLHPLKLESGRDGFLYVPAGVNAERPAPFVLMLHGAGGDARHSLPLLRGFADKHGVILLAADSRGQTWDVIVSDYGPDVEFIDRALEQTFRSYHVDAARVGVAGFSDGASYALSLGATNGDLFTHVLAFSPGFMAPAARRGSPALFVSHGTKDRVLPVEVCSRRIVPRVRREGYEVLYREFDGPHTVPHDIAAGAVAWFLAGE